METKGKKNHKLFSQRIGKMEKRKLKAQGKERSVWSGFAVFGMVGWSVVVPLLLGAALGIWLDKKYPESFSWTLTFLFLGLIAGCLIAWQWIEKENREMHKDKNGKDE